MRRGLLAGVAFVLAGLACVAEGARRRRPVWKQVGRWSLLIPVGVGVNVEGGYFCPAGAKYAVKS